MPLGHRPFYLDIVGGYRVLLKKQPFNWQIKFIVKSKNMFTVHQGTNTPPPLARIVSSPIFECISNYGFYYKTLLLKKL